MKRSLRIVLLPLVVAGLLLTTAGPVTAVDTYHTDLSAAWVVRKSTQATLLASYKAFIVAADARVNARKTLMAQVKAAPLAKKAKVYASGLPAMAVTKADMIKAQADVSAAIIVSRDARYAVSNIIKAHFIEIQARS